MVEPTKVFVIWARLRDGSQHVHCAKLDEEMAERMISQAMRSETASCGCCENPSPAQVLGIESMWIETLVAT